MPKRALYAVLAWGAATASAMAVVTAGLDSVLPTATEGPHVATVAAWPVQGATSTGLGSAVAVTGGPGTPSAGGASATAGVPGAGATSPGIGASGRNPGGGPGATGSPAGPGPTSPAASPAGTQRRYSTPGGTAVLTLFPDSAVLDAATPAPGYSARSWTNSDFLEVEFSPADGGTVYEVIATWNGTSPQVRTYAVGG